MLKIEVDKDKIFYFNQDNGKVLLNEKEFEFDFPSQSEADTFHILLKNKGYNIELVEFDKDQKLFKLKINGRIVEAKVKDSLDLLVEKMGLPTNEGSKINNIKAPMPGLIINLLVNVGDVVDAGTTLVVLEAMKMENIIKSPGKGTIKSVKIKNIHMKYKRILLKLSGEALMGSKNYGIDQEILSQYAKEIKAVTDKGVQLGIVIGGGNIYRGMEASTTGIDRVQGDYMGMLATVINGMALQSSLERTGLYTRLLSGIKIEQVCEPFIRRRAIRHLEKGRIVIFGAGTGNPYFTTDSAASLRAIEVQADVVLKGTRVDGVYDKDPEKFSDAVRYEKLSFQEAYSKKLNIMDMTAFTLCMENKLPIIVFDMNKKGNLLKVAKGEEAGTLIS